MTPSNLGKLALGDPAFVFQLRRGRSPTLVTVDKVNAWMRLYRAGLRAKAAVPVESGQSTGA